MQVLLRTGHRQKEVAKLTSVSLRTVQRIAREPVVTALDEPSSHPRGRPSDIERFREPIVEWLSAEPGMDTVDVLAPLCANILETIRSLKLVSRAEEDHR